VADRFEGHLKVTDSLLRCPRLYVVLAVDAAAVK